MNNDTKKEIVNELKITKSKNIFLGFDGVIDHILKVVDKRFDKKNIKPIEYIKNFSKKIEQAANKSCNIEWIENKKQLGGNGPLMAKSLIKLDNNINYIGTLGKPEINPVFSKFYKKCSNIHSIGKPAITHAAEFKDGKIMFGNMKDLLNINWTKIKKEVGRKKIKSYISSSDLIAFLNWTMIPNMDSIIKGIFNLIKDTINNMKIFIDITDPAKRKKKELLSLLKLLEKINKKYNVIIGLNENEASQVLSSLGINSKTKEIEDIALKISKNLKIYQVVVHSVKYAAVAYKNKSFKVNGPYIENPVITTGAGDHFNAAYCYSILNNIKPKNALYIAAANSGYYVRNGKSANKNNLINFIKSIY